MDEQELKVQKSLPVEYLSGMFTYQINLLATASLLEKQLSKNVEQRYAKHEAFTLDVQLS